MKKNISNYSRKHSYGESPFYPSMLRFVLILALVFVVFDVAQAQVQVSKITGKVIHEDGTPIVGATVMIKGTLTGVITSIDGTFELSAKSDQTLIISFLGYKTVETKISNRDIINVVLEEDNLQMDEVVVIGYAQQSRSRVVSAISKVDAEEFENIASVNPIQALQGKVAGAIIPVTSGQPGQGAKMVIRGGTSLDPFRNAEPLYVVDGIFRSNMDDINSNDIADIQILKDAASTAIYGARASNGVVVIKTKGGKFMQKSKVTYSYQHGIDVNTREFDYMNAEQYLATMRPVIARGLDNYNVHNFLYVTGNAATVPTFTKPGQYGTHKFTTAYMNNLVDIEGQAYVDKLLANGWQTMDDPVSPGNTIIFKDSQYQDVVWQTANTSNHNLGISGGGEKSTYNVSLGYIDQGGTLIGTNYRRFSALANTSHKVSERLKIDVNFNYSWNDRRMTNNETNDLVRGLRIPPLNRLYNDDGTPNLGESNNPRNWLHSLYYQDYNRTTSKISGRVGADLKIIEGLHFRPSASLITSVDTRLDFEKYYPQQGKQRFKHSGMSREHQIMTDQILQYGKTFGADHNFMALVGFNYTMENSFEVSGESERSGSDYISTITGDPISSIIGGTVRPNMKAASLYSEKKSASVFAQATYDYKGKYMLAASFRRDGFSNFAPDNQWANFPSLAFGWNIHNEDFWDVKFMNQFKFRSSYGTTGMSSLSMADTYGKYESDSYNTNSGILRDNLPNPNLVWETTESFDLGFDASFFNSRLRLVADYYNKHTKDRLTTYPLPSETGFKDIKYNVGAVRNRGFELEVHARVLDGSNLRWETSVVFAFNRAMITELPDNGREKNRIGGGLVYDPVSGKDIDVGGYAEGERPQGLWGFQAEGIYATNAEAIAHNIEDTYVSSGLRGKPKNGGDVKWADLNGDKVIDNKDIVFMGYKTPDKTGGWQNTFSYKGLSLRVNMEFALGHVINDGALARSMGSSRSFNEGAPALAMSDETWQKEGHIGAKYPRYSFGDWDIGHRNHQRSIIGYTGMGNSTYGTDNSLYYSKGDYLALREVSLSYSLPQTIVKKLLLNDITLNAAGYNLGYLTAYEGQNPETTTGFDPGGYPRPMQFTFGVNLTF